MSKDMFPDLIYSGLFLLVIYALTAVLSVGGFALFKVWMGVESPATPHSCAVRRPGPAKTSFLHKPSLRVYPSHAKSSIYIYQSEAQNAANLKEVREVLDRVVNPERSYVDRLYGQVCGCEGSLAECSLGWPERPCLALTVNRVYGFAFPHRYLSLKCSSLSCVNLAPFRVSPAFIDTQAREWNATYKDGVWTNECPCRPPAPFLFTIQPSGRWDSRFLGSAGHEWACVLRGRNETSHPWRLLGKEIVKPDYVTEMGRFRLVQRASQGQLSPTLLLFSASIASLITG